VTKHFAGEADEPAVALQDVTVEIDRGEFVSVSGPSGCGKSTFLSILGLLDTPTSGRYYLKGRPTDRLSHAERARTRNVDIGLVFQSFNLIADLTVYENVEYPLTIKGASPEERRRRVMAALDRVGLSARAGQRPSSLSGGHQQLVSIARAIAGQPPIILADEPTGNLDPETAQEVFDLLLELNEDLESTLVVVTHSHDLAQRFPRRLHLAEGRFQETAEGSVA
jgi:putative ABC transport system ATP-binding protein